MDEIMNKTSSENREERKTESMIESQNRHYSFN